MREVIKLQLCRIPSCLLYLILQDRKKIATGDDKSKHRIADATSRTVVTHALNFCDSHFVASQTESSDGMMIKISINTLRRSCYPSERKEERREGSEDRLCCGLCRGVKQANCSSCSMNSV
jgi:hypothetical protein